MSDVCRSCSAPIRWVIMAKSNKSMPIDLEPSSKGNIIIREDGKAVYVSNEETIGVDPSKIFVSHFATCPQGKKWRKT